MSNNKNITMSTNTSYGYNLSRTSYDTHQEISAKVIGVLKYNNDLREKILKRNIGSYGMLPSNEGIGNISNIYSIETSKPFSLGEDGLLGYTHINESDYQTEINHRYDIGDFISYYRGGSLPTTNQIKWKGLYDDYTKYIDDTFGLNYTSLNLLADLFNTSKVSQAINTEYSRDRSLTIQSILNDFLQYDNIKHAMEQTRIGTVIPNPDAAFAGSITTNINNFSGTDTPLGIITNSMYAHTLRNAAQFNSIRRTPYITPGVYENLGLKMSTIANMNVGYRVDPDTGRLAYELGEGIGVGNYDLMTLDIFQQMDVIDKNKDVASSQNARYRNLSRSAYLPFSGFKYNENYTPIPTLTTNFVKTSGNKTYYFWNEGDKGNHSIEFFTDSNVSINQKLIEMSQSSNVSDQLITKTNSLFQSHDETGIDTLIGRFHTSGGRDKTHNEANLFQTAISSFGMSHGRNLLNKDAYETGIAKKTNGYENPYCRTWTYHHQYGKLGDTIRPFTNNTMGEYVTTGVDIVQKDWWKYGRRGGSASRLRDNSVLNSNGMVNITPTKPNQKGSAVDIKKCMFSIENLAWKTHKKYNGKSLSPEQTGPNGGRIMWFPPYDLKFNEQVGVNWNPVDFIGRGEKIYTYTNTERTGTLSFALLVDHPSVIDMWRKNSALGLDEDEKEQTLLRFFAGCEVLDFNNKKIVNEEPSIIPVQPKPTPVIPIVEEKVEELVFYIFFPNNYSGIDDYEKRIDDYVEEIRYDLSDGEKKSEGHIENVFQYLYGEYESSLSTNVTHKELYTDKKWKYRVDKAYENHVMSTEDNYDDTTNFKLNSDLSAVKKDSNFSDANFTLGDVYTGNLPAKITEKGKKIKHITVTPYASSHGRKEDNIKLYTNRGRMATYWLQQTLTGFFDYDFSNIACKSNHNQIIEVDEIDKGNISGESAKRGRCVKISIGVVVEETVRSAENMTVDTSKTATTVTQNMATTNVTDSTSSSKAQKRAKKKNNNSTTLAASTSNTIMEERKAAISADIRKQTEESLPTIKAPLNLSRMTDDIKILSASEMEAKRREMVEKDVTWDKEAQYFQMLEANDSLLYNKLIDKIKFFNPAFHSITPEGFNARLGFLHQCTRQGNTVGASESGLKSAGNLAFGRPPICVLRIGDFFHTKIIIQSISIDYETPQWDINTEGIGVQPMFARISMNFVFLGGSDIEAPISRLQNALTFNYYANQSIYDKRADMGMYEFGKPTIQGTPWLPGYDSYESTIKVGNMESGVWDEKESYDELKGKSAL